MSNRTQAVIVAVSLPLAFGLISCGETTGPVQPPTVTITSPPDGATFNEGESILFEGSATRDGSALPGSTLLWRSDRDGELGVGPSFARSDLSVNAHVITLEATPADGPSGSSSITITTEALQPVNCQVRESTFSLPVSPDDLTGVTQAHGRHWDLSNVFGDDSGPRLSHHVGLDLAAPQGRPVFPAASGCVWRVVEEEAASGFGNTVVLLHELQDGDSIFTQYSHLHEIADWIREACEPQEGTNGLCSNPVEADLDTPLGTVGMTGNVTGPHVHFEVKETDTDSLASPYGDFGYTPSRWHPDERGYHDPILWLHSTEPGIGSFFPREVQVTDRVSGVTLQMGPDPSRYRCLEFPDCILMPGGAGALAIREAPPTTGCAEGWYQIVMDESLLGIGGRLQSRPDQYFPDASELAPDASQPSAWICMGDDERWVAQPPSVEILSPDDGATFSSGESITFDGSATDPEDGELTGDALVWDSDREGEIGTGQSLTRDDLSIEAHTITLTATNSVGLTAFASVEIEVEDSSPGAGQWAWEFGSATHSQPGVYGNRGSADPSSVPGARSRSVSWMDGDGDLWLFGGVGYDAAGVMNSRLNDLWRFDGVAWTWISGSPNGGQTGVYGTQGSPAATNVPGARFGSVSWIGAGGNLWLFGGDGYDGDGGLGRLNDLWRFDGTNWTWVSGSRSRNHAGVYGTQGNPESGNVPGARKNAVSWVDGSGDLWLFGGSGYDGDGTQGHLNDLWRFDGAVWTWVSGSSSAGQAGVYGTQGSSDAGNVPGAREGGVSWTDGDGNLWLFGGIDLFGPIEGFFARRNDLWRFDGANWTWVSGSSDVNQAGRYGIQGESHPSNVPGGREAPTSWIDANDNLWLFGGWGYDRNGSLGHVNDLWRFDGTNWTWVSGSSAIDQAGIYGTKGEPNSANVPGGRLASVSFHDGRGFLWLFGGHGIDIAGQTGVLNDLWRFRTR